MKCQWLAGSFLDRLTNVFVKRFLIKQTHFLEAVHACSFGQLPPVMDLPLYTTASRSPLSDQGSTAYHLFDHAIVLKQVMHQSGQDPDQELFCNILLRLRDARLTTDDWEQFMKQTPAEVSDLIPFTNALHLYPTIETVVKHNVAGNGHQ